MTTREKCGTYAGWNQHMKVRQTPCDECRLARNEYMRNRRRSNPAARAREYELTAARDRALSRLAAEYPDRYRELYVEELNR